MSEQKIPEWMKPWHGGDSAPADCPAFTTTKLRCGRIVYGMPNDDLRWAHTGGEEHRAEDIIAYTPMPANPNTPVEMVEVTQADRNAAADLHHWYNGQTSGAEEAMRSGSYDDDDRVQAFARHRLSHAKEQEAGVDAKQPGTARCVDPRGHEFMTWDLPADVGDGWTMAIEIERMLLKCFEHGRQYQMEIVSNAMVDLDKQRNRDGDHV